jgi:hypothetical protein
MLETFPELSKYVTYDGEKYVFKKGGIEAAQKEMAEAEAEAERQAR